MSKLKSQGKFLVGDKVVFKKGVTVEKLEGIDIILSAHRIITEIGTVLGPMGTEMWANGRIMKEQFYEVSFLEVDKIPGGWYIPRSYLKRAPRSGNKTTNLSV